MLKVLVSAHSGLRWIVLLLLLLAIIRAFARKSSGKYEKSDKMINLFAMVFVHLQVTLGIVLAFISPKVKMGEGMMVMPYRFFSLEHALLMLIAAVVLTVGRKKAEQLVLTDPAKAHGKIAMWYTAALVIILAGIPWPFRTILGAGWM